MRMLTVSIVIGPLMLIGALPAAGQSTLALGSGAPVQLAAGADSAADRDTYTQMALDEIQKWQGKLHNFSEKAAAKRDRGAQVRTRLAAGGRSIRTLGPPVENGAWACFGGALGLLRRSSGKFPRANCGSHLTPRWREMDSNHQYPVKE